MGNRGKGFFIIYVILLCISLGNEMDFIDFNRAIRPSLNFVEPFTSNHSLALKNVN